MSNQASADSGRRGAIIATSAVGGLGALCTAVPFVSTFAPSEKARAAGAPVEVDVGALKEGERMIVEWRGKPVWIVRRSKEMLDSLAKTESKVADPKSERKPSELTPEYCRNTHRSIKPDLLVAVGICSHLGCSPTGPFPAGGNVTLGDDMGFVCPCHGSTFDMAGRVWKAKPAPDNLEIPPHTYLSDTRLLIGEDKKGA
ncbi:MAG: ubiquinol-cytochrome c reductase iron-sulfur subunit [Burkholderiales bacterium]